MVSGNGVNGEEKDVIHNQEERMIPVIEEHVVINKKIVETGKIQVQKTIISEESLIDLTTTREVIDVQRVAINQYIDAAPVTRQEGDITIIPVIKEVIVMEKKLLLVEEIRISKKLVETTEKQTISLRREDVKINHILNESDNNINN